MATANATSPANDSYVLTPGTGYDGTHRVAEVQLVPAALVRCFGPGQPGDGFKVSREWIFQCGDLVFTVYDWKSTSLYDADLWRPEELWASPVPWDLHVGSKSPATERDVEAFIDYLCRETAR